MVGRQVDYIQPVTLVRAGVRRRPTQPGSLFLYPLSPNTDDHIEGYVFRVVVAAGGSAWSCDVRASEGVGGGSGAPGAADGLPSHAGHR